MSNYCGTPLKSNVASQTRYVQANTPAGVAVTSSLSIDVSIDGASFNPAAGILAHITAGLWSYTFTQAETNGSTEILLQLSGGSVEPGLVVFPVRQFNAVVEVHPARTWRLLSSRGTPTSPDVVTINESELLTLSMDFGEWLNDGSLIDTVDSVAAAGLTIGNLAPSTDKRKAFFDLTAGHSADTSYEVTVTVSTTDGQTIIGTGTLKCE